MRLAEQKLLFIAKSTKKYYSDRNRNYIKKITIDITGDAKV